jgi:hypothetical protein
MVSKWLSRYGYNIIMIIYICSYYINDTKHVIIFLFSLRMDKAKILILHFGTFSFFFFFFFHWSFWALAHKISLCKNNTDVYRCKSLNSCILSENVAPINLLAGYVIHNGQTCPFTLKDNWSLITGQLRWQLSWSLWNIDMSRLSACSCGSTPIATMSFQIVFSY